MSIEGFLLFLLYIRGTLNMWGIFFYDIGDKTNPLSVLIKDARTPNSTKKYLRPEYQIKKLIMLYFDIHERSN